MDPSPDYSSSSDETVSDHGDSDFYNDSEEEFFEKFAWIKNVMYKVMYGVEDKQLEVLERRLRERLEISHSSRVAHLIPRVDSWITTLIRELSPSEVKNWPEILDKAKETFYRGEAEDDEDPYCRAFYNRLYSIEGRLSRVLRELNDELDAIEQKFKTELEIDSSSEVAFMAQQVDPRLTALFRELRVSEREDWLELVEMCEYEFEVMGEDELKRKGLCPTCDDDEYDDLLSNAFYKKLCSMSASISRIISVVDDELEELQNKLKIELEIDSSSQITYLAPLVEPWITALFRELRPSVPRDWIDIVRKNVNSFEEMGMAELNLNNLRHGCL